MLSGNVVKNESNMALYFPEAGNLNGSNAEMCFHVARPSSSGSGDLFELPDRSRFPNFTISPLLALLAFIFDLSVTATPILPFFFVYPLHSMNTNEYI